MKHLNNIHDPSSSYRIQYLFLREGQTHTDALMQEDEWLFDKVIGLPKPTDNMTVKQLQEINMVGVYTKE